jgi:hypothetical protein
MQIPPHLRFRAVVVAFLMLVGASSSVAEKFQWNWRQSQELTAERSLRSANLPKIEKASLAKALANQLKPMMADLGIESDKQFQEAILDTRIEMVDLNGDGSPEVIAQGIPGCSPTGNCPFWIFQRMTHGYKLLLDGFGQTFTVQRSRTNGFRDIVVAMHGSSTESTLTLYRYASSRYHDVECYEAAWSVLEGDTTRQLKEPRISPCGSQSLEDFDSISNSYR